ncbi:4-hydroxy-tetrahydrodipicolinate synthase [Faecalimonas sp.]
MESIFVGSGVALVTPFCKDGSINVEMLEELVEYHCANQTDGIIVCGTTGESATLSKEERLLCIKRVVEFAKGKVPIIAGTGTNCTRTTVQLSKEAENCGVDGVLIVTPYYNKPTQEGLIAHYENVAKNIKIPMIIYNVGNRTGCNIEPETISLLARENENIVGVKEASGSISQVAKIVELTKGKIDVYAGNDNQIVPVLSLGGKGVISVLANIAPREVHKICNDFFIGNIKESCALQLKALPLIRQLSCEVNPIPIKKALSFMGKDVGSLRMPLLDLGEEKGKTLARIMCEYGIKLSQKVKYG